MKSKRLRNAIITIFVILWTIVFHYESVRHFYLNPLFEKPLPKVKFLFPPAGWIMFFRVDDQFGHYEVYGVKGDDVHLIDPHEVFRVRTIGFDNIHRGVLGSAANRQRAPNFCRHLRNRFPYYDKFLVRSIYYPSITKEPYKRYQKVQYQCAE